MPNSRVPVTFARRLLTLLLAFAMLPAIAAERVALVIGNGSYQAVQGLPNPPRDAELIDTTLRGLDFKVTRKVNLGKAQMEREILAFGRSAQGAEIALVFYAGHGIQADGRNYLLPVDAQLVDDLALQVEAVNLDLLLRATQGAKTRLILLDACRNNPFTPRMRMSNAGRSIGRGLAPVEAASGGTLIAFSTSPNEIALDDDGINSPFARALGNILPKPGLEIRQVFTQVRQAVYAQTGKRQTPWENSSLFGDVFLSGSGVAQVVPKAGSDGRTGVLAIEVSPSDAEVLINDALLPAGVREVPDLPPGQLEITARRAGYSQQVAKVRIMAGQRTHARMTLNAVTSESESIGTPNVASRPSTSALSDHADSQATPMTSPDPAAEKAAYDAAFSALKDGSYAESARRFQSFIDRYPDGDLVSRAYYWLGESYFVRENFSVAQDTFQEILTRYPASERAPHALLKVGLCQIETKQWDKAEATLNDVIARYPNSFSERLAQDRLRLMKLKSKR